MPRTRTPAEEILFSVQQWYLFRGLRVPADELKVCKDDIEKERVLNEYNGAVIMKRRLEYERDLMNEEARFEKKEVSYEKVAEYVERIAAASKIIASMNEADRPADAPVPKSSYGSSNFWKEHWAKKKAAGWVPKNAKSPSASKK
jgi:hypothetical protein